MSFAVAQYRTTKLAVQSPLSSLIAVYEGALRFLETAVTCDAERNIAGRGVALSRAHAIVTELRAGLDHQVAPEIAGQLDRLYDFVQHQILQATLRNSASEVAPAIDVLQRLLSAWKEIAKQGTP